MSLGEATLLVASLTLILVVIGVSMAVYLWRRQGKMMSYVVSMEDDTRALRRDEEFHTHRSLPDERSGLT